MRKTWAFALFATTLFGCEAIERWQGPPIKPGNQLSYGVSEVGPDSKKIYVLRFQISEGDNSQVGLRIVGDSGERRFIVTPELSSRRDNPIRLPLVSSATVGPAMLWLPPSQRTTGQQTAAGMLGPVEGYKDWRVWQAENEANGTESTHYFEIETGVLVGFLFVQGSREISGTLMSMR